MTPRTDDYHLLARRMRSAGTPEEITEAARTAERVYRAGALPLGDYRRLCENEADRLVALDTRYESA